jgi:cytochrome c biogenesis protein CcdA/glutaredoxin
MGKVLLFLMAFLIAEAVLADANSDICPIDEPCPPSDDKEQTQDEEEKEEGKGEDGIVVYYFYITDCPQCVRIEPLIEEIDQKYEVVIKKYEVRLHEEHLDLFMDFAERFSLSSPGVPTVFIGEKALVGLEKIKGNLEEAIRYYLENPDEYKDARTIKLDTEPKANLTIPVIITAALVDSINPCAFAVLTFLLVYLLALGTKRRMLRVGLTYIVVIFIVYFLSGFGLFVSVQGLGASRVVFSVAAWVAVIAGLINVKDFFWYGKGPTLKIPESKKPLLESFVRRASIPAAVALGFLVSLFELPCTGGIYLAILGLLADRTTQMSAVPYLLLYNMVFVLPLVVILFIISLGFSPERVESWRLGGRRWMKLSMGLFMIGLGISMLAGWV